MKVKGTVFGSINCLFRKLLLTWEWQNPVQARAQAAVLEFLSSLYRQIYSPSRLQLILRCLGERGCVGCVVYLKEHHPESCGPSTVAIGLAATNGHFKVVQYLNDRHGSDGK
ncbi:hypothetical protein AC1031_008862 [Aphanomyces cochlioides]|nr:hypothetical protein AC1031_008862 [Aphanomyces cochlioides]